MSLSSNISICARHASNLCGVIRLAPFLWGTAPSSSSISCSTKLQQPTFALCFENTSAFGFKTARNNSKSPSPIFPLSVLSLAKPLCQILVHMTRGVPEISSSSTSRCPFRISLKTVYVKFKFINSFENYIFVFIIRAVLYVISLQVLCLFTLIPPLG